MVMTFTFSCIYEITAIKISQMPSDLGLDTSKLALKDTLTELTKKNLQVIKIPCSKP